jgi:hypothetical protein
MKMSHQNQKYTGAALASKIAAQEWAEDYADLLTCFNTEQVNKSLLGLFATTHRGDQSIRYAELCVAFIDLVDRGVLVPEFKSGIADEELLEMRKRFAPKTVSVAASVVPSEAPAAQAPAALAADALSECCRDYQTMSSAAFRSRWMSLPKNRQVYEAAISAGRI